MFNFFKKNLSKIYQSITKPFNDLFQKKELDQETIRSLEKILLEADTGTKTTKKILVALQDKFSKNEIQTGAQLESFLAKELILQLQTPEQKKIDQADIIFLVGINGSGKTTFAAKLGHWFQQKKEEPTFVAADTFRAAANTQLASWAEKLSIKILAGKENQDPASVVFDATKQYQPSPQTKLIIDTAGRLQSKEHLMSELTKMKKTALKNCPQAKFFTLLVVDSMLGQNSINQAEIFKQAVDVDGIALTKMDGTAQGGVIFAITQKLAIPVIFLSWGEKIEDMALFDPTTYVQNLLQIEKTI